MRKITYLLFLLAFFTSCTDEPKKVEVVVQNPSKLDRLTDMVELSASELRTKLAASDTTSLIVTNAAKEVVPSQITSDGKLIFQAGLKSSETAVYSVRTGPKQDYKAKTYGRFITERKDDFAWENDRVAFRVYGPALVATDGPSNGIDLWFKRTPEMIIDKWYKNDLAGTASYHDDHGEGLDDYKVGRTLGGGAMAPYIDNKLWLNENFVSQAIIDNGPLRTTFKLTYKDMDVNGKIFTESRIFSIDAGSQLTKVSQEYGTKEDMRVAAGIVKRESGDSIIVASDKTYILHLEPKTNKVEGVYGTVVFPQGFDEMVMDNYTIKNGKTKKDDSYSHVLAVATYRPNTAITYYVGYGWNKYGFADEKDFEKYIQNFVKTTKEPLVISIK